MKIKIITVGKKPEPAMDILIQEYEKRLREQCKLEWHVLPAGRSSQEEAKTILNRVQPNDYVILLDETGSQLTNDALSSKLEAAPPKDLAFIIGGAFGVSESVKQRADFTLSLSTLVFPHQIVRLILVEQIYRSFMIMQGHPYHHK